MHKLWNCCVRKRVYLFYSNDEKKTMTWSLSGNVFSSNGKMLRSADVKRTILFIEKT